MMAQNCKDLIAWQEAMPLINAVCQGPDTFPKRETGSATDQIRWVAVSIPSNIGEGKAHQSKREFIHWLRHCRASLAELETQVLIRSTTELSVRNSGG
jgi:four helix bundle protein